MATKPDYKWIISMGVTLIVMGAGFQYSRGANAQEMKDTIRCIQEQKAELEKTKVEQNTVNKELLNAIIDLKVAIGELRTELRVQRK
jgi:hypothetical protein